MAFTLLYEPSDPYTTTLVESVLAQRGIECRVIERGLQSTLFGMPGGSGTIEMLVPEESLEVAKQVLCEHDIMCDVSERMRARCFESFALPLLRGESDELGRLVNYLRVNNKTTVGAILDDIAQHAKGPRLLVRLFFHLLAGDEHATLLRLTHFLNEHIPEELSRRIELESGQLAAEIRRNLAEMLGLLPALEPAPLLVELLGDADVDVREAAIESLFALTSEDYGFEPDAPEEERMRAVAKWEAAVRRKE